ncbi:hypothetical protein DK427_08290 [Methylobacterium radiodurans]|uniref:Helix-turn-helix domain-containing protein n=1 Tax=Methylobacterium radiodurans TaxID=2202828 RepID=A0A2U8W0C9_9HYPH|nr:hypothetical protein DK427_08290 [Methylobacterium radiodurans]
MICYTPKEVADRWKCSAAHVRKMIDNGELPAFRAGGKLLRVPESALQEYERCQNTSSSVSVEAGPSPSIKEGSASAVASLNAAMRRERQRSSAESSRTRSAR